MKAVNTALFGATWWPFASFEALRIATYLGSWVGSKNQTRLSGNITDITVQLFAWDDGAISFDLELDDSMLIQICRNRFRRILFSCFRPWCRSSISQRDCILHTPIFSGWFERTIDLDDGQPDHHKFQDYWRRDSYFEYSWWLKHS